MVQAIGMQQVLQLSSTVEKAQMAQQSQASELAKGFDKEMQKIVERQSDQTQEIKETEDAKIRDEDQRKRKHYARKLPQGHPEEDEEEEGAAPPSESDQGGLINVVV
ncbi:MAG TPA: hypothetical protein ENI77_10395 [Nitrospirae bacterium]|nr:hypothetical protein [Nitrospirota bacterium]